MKLHASWKKGRYISCGDLWLCLSLDITRQFSSPEKTDYTHYAFNVDAKDFLIVVDRLMQAMSLSGKKIKVKEILLLS